MTYNDNDDADGLIIILIFFFGIPIIFCFFWMIGDVLCRMEQREKAQALDACVIPNMTCNMTDSYRMIVEEPFSTIATPFRHWEIVPTAFICQNATTTCNVSGKEKECWEKVKK